MNKLMLFILMAIPTLSYAGVSCTISDFEVEVYDHGGTYIHGKLNGVNVNWIVINGIDGNEDATNRRLSLATAAEISGHNLEAYFDTLDNCADYKDYTRVTGLKLKK